MRYSTSELLEVADVSASTFAQWLLREHLFLSGEQHPGTGNPRQHTARDVLQVACLAELARLGVPPNRGKLVWRLAVGPNVAPPVPMPDVTVLLAPRADGSDCDMRVVRHGDWGLDHPGAPAAFAVLRVSALAERVAARLEALRERAP